MESYKVRLSDIGSRLDTFFYRPEFTQLEKKIRVISNKKLAEYVLSISSGATPDTKKSEKFYSDEENGFPFLRVQNVSEEGLILENCKYINKKTHEELLKRSQVREFDLITKITGVGKMAISAVAPAGFKGNINQHLVVIKTRNKETSNTLAAFLNSDIGEKLALRRTTGGTRPALDYTALKSIPIVYNPKIVIILEKAYKEKKRKAIEGKSLLESINCYTLKKIGIFPPEIKEKNCYKITSSAIREGRFDPLYHIMGDFSFLDNCKCKIESLEENADYFKIGFAAGHMIQNQDEEGIIQIRPTNIADNGTIILNKNIYIKDHYLETKSEYLLKPKEVLFNNTNSQELVGKSAIFNFTGNYFCSNHITRILAKPDKILAEYLCLILNDYRRIGIFFGICTNWNNQSGVNINLLKKLKIPVPSLAIQNDIVKEIKMRQINAQTLLIDAENEIVRAKEKVNSIILGVDYGSKI